MIKARSQKSHPSLNIISSFTSIKKDNIADSNISVCDSNIKITLKSAPIAQMESEDDFTSRSLRLSAIENTDLLFNMDTVAEALKVFFFNTHIFLFLVLKFLIRIRKA